MADEQTLLEEFKPLLRYDSNEGYFADSAAEMTDPEGNLLRRAGGETIAAPGPGADDLSLAFLAAEGAYPNGEEVRADDLLSVTGDDYLDQYREIRAENESYRNVIYGRVVESSGATWLQYWFWFYYNDLRALGIGLGLHEGDWEGLQLRLDGEEPDIAVYAQHAYAEAKNWSAVQKSGKRPIVYVAQGSHASYFDDGGLNHWHKTEHFIDRADGKITPQSELRLEVLTDEDPPWARWPGRWGDTQKTKGPFHELSSNSPTGPGSKAHWRDPEALLEAAREVGRAPGVAAWKPPEAPVPPARPQVEPRLEDRRLRLAYDATPGEDERAPTHLLVTVNSPDDPFPPTTYRLPAEDRRGTVEVPLDADPDHRYQFRVSGLTEDGALSEPSEEEVGPG